MRRLYLPPDAFAATEARLDRDAAHRLRNVLRLRPGDPLRVFDGRGHEREATLADSSRDAVVLALGAEVDPLPEPPVSLVVACAFPRGQRGDWLVEKATELGAAAFVPLPAERAVLQPGEGRVERWRRIAIEAAEQCGRAVVPTFEDAPPADALHLLADPAAPRTPRAALAEVSPPPLALALYVGPEGGFTPGERAALVDGGAVPVHLGPRRLRVETAALALLAEVAVALDAGPPRT